VLPGDQLVLELKLTNRRSKIAVMQGRAYVDGNLVAEAELSAAVMARSSSSAAKEYSKPNEKFSVK
jgi:3-hydroxymyristoyl/3-hydroxydecanoyl-(acyl carrier protein) dehydratase